MKTNKNKKKYKPQQKVLKRRRFTTTEYTQLYNESGAEPLLTTSRPGDEIILFFAFEIENEKLNKKKKLKLKAETKI